MSNAGMSELPPSWQWSTLGEITVPAVDQGGPVDGTEFVYVDIGSVDNETKRIVGPRALGVVDAPSRARQRIAVDDVLVSMTRPNLNAVARVPVELDGAIASTGFHVLRSAGVNARWIEYVVQTTDFIESMTRRVQGALYPAVRPHDIRSYRIPVPPLAEQRRIIAALEEQLSDLDAAVAGLKRAKTNATRYRGAVIAAAVVGRLDSDSASWSSADELQLPDGWPWIQLRDVADIKGGVTKGQKRPPGQRVREVPYLRVANVQRGYLDLREVKCIDATDDDIRELCLRPGDVLFNEGGDRDKLGRGWVWSGEIEECIHQNHVFRARLDPARFNPKFVSHFGNTWGQRYFLDQGKQTTNLASINLTKLGALRVPAPSREVQDEIVDRLEQRLAVADRTAAEIDIQLARAARLRRAILKSAFDGKLVPQDPSDEPASTLLAIVRGTTRPSNAPTSRPRDGRARATVRRGTD